MRMYDVNEIEFLQRETGTITDKGLKVLLKRSPSELRAGYLDHHELNIMKEHWVAREEQEEARELTAEEALQATRDSMGFPNRNLNTVEIHTKFESLKIGENEVGLWRYYPRTSQYRTDRPCFIFIHGGGWIGGTPYTVENPCRLIAELADAVVFNIDYSLAPEKKFPHGFNDCFGVLKHIYTNAERYGVDREKIAMGGDSAGGNLTAAVAMKDRDLSTNMLALQVLIYACVTLLSAGIPGYHFDIGEFDMSEEQKTLIDKLISIGRPANSKDDSVMLGNMYITNKGAAYHPYVSPMLAGCHEGLPPALCVSAEFDGLRVQTEHYARLLEKAGVRARAIRYKGVAHAFIDKLGFVPQAEDLCIEIAKAIKEL